MVHFITLQSLHKHRRIVGHQSEGKMNIQAIVLVVTASIAVTFCIEVEFKDCGSKINVTVLFYTRCLVNASQDLISLAVIDGEYPLS